MKPDEFEQQLRSQPVRPVPPAWRAEILTVARALTRPGSDAGADSIVRMASWRAWFWPCPQAWAALAAVWLILIGFYLSPPASSRLLAGQEPTAEKKTALAAQRRELARLLDAAPDPSPAALPSQPGPRSESDSPVKA
ncbi:MAG: hypothetical protein QOF48_221 [Verrucomicrobiota bacterium]|jgi:hypothetical protein